MRVSQLIGTSVLQTRTSYCEFSSWSHFQTLYIHIRPQHSSRSLHHPRWCSTWRGCTHRSFLPFQSAGRSCSCIQRSKSSPEQNYQSSSATWCWCVRVRTEQPEPNRWESHSLPTAPSETLAAGWLSHSSGLYLGRETIDLMISCVLSLTQRN